MKKRSFATKKLMLAVAVVCMFANPNVARADYVNIQEAISDTVTPREFILPSAQNVTSALGAMGGENATLTIDGGATNKYGINGNGNSGVSVASGQTLILKNIGSVTVSGDGKAVTDYTVNSSINGFVTSASGGGVNNAGTLTVSDTVFSNNQANTSGGAISNSGASANITGISNVTFYGNSTSNVGAAISNSSGATIGNINANIVNNAGEGSHVYGVGINNSGGASIANISGKFVGNTLNSTYWALGQIYNENSSIQNISSDFLGNSATGAWLYGGAIYNEEASIGNISGNFENNTAISPSTYLSGSVISNTSVSTIGNITGNFRNNTAECANGTLAGIISNMVDSSQATSGQFSTIGNISGNFENNQLSGKTVYGVIFNQYSRINNITGDFKNNTLSGTTVYGGIVNYGGTVASINKIEGSTFEGNTATGSSVAIGAAITNFGTITNGIINSKFIGNKAISDTDAGGAAIYTNKNLSIIADGSIGDGISTFKGNYIKYGDTKLYEAVWVSGATRILTIEAKNGGTINLYDYISGSTGYTTRLTGDNTGTMNLYNEIKRSNVVADNVDINMNLADNNYHQWDLVSLNINANAKWTLDINAETETADAIATTNASAGTITIDGFNIVAGDITEDTEKIQLLKTPNNNLHLALSTDAAAEKVLHHTTTSLTYDEVTENTAWDDVLNAHEEYINKIGKFVLDTTDTTNDSIVVKYLRDESGSSVTPADTLYVVNRAETDFAKNFNFADSSNQYDLTVDLTTTKGTVNINGVKSGDNRSSINFDGHKGFDLDANSVLNISNTELKNGKDVIVNVGGKLNISDSVFSNNTAEESGGAISNSAGGTISSVTGDFVENHANISAVSSGSEDADASTSGGGAIFNAAKMDNVEGDFIGNYATVSATSSGSGDVNAYASGGGAIFLKDSDAKMGNVTGDFIGNYAIVSATASGDGSADAEQSGGGAINNNFGEMGNITGDFTGNYTIVSAIAEETATEADTYYSGGGAIRNNGTMGNITGNFLNNYAISSVDSAGSSVADGNLAGGGAIYNSKTIGVITADFIGNYTNVSATSSGDGTANSDLSGGGAIYNSDFAEIAEIKGDFTENYAIISATSNSDSDADASRAGGGAIYQYVGTIGDITGDFTENYANVSALSSGSECAGAGQSGGGAIYSVSEIGNVAGKFTGNYTNVSVVSSGTEDADASTSGGGAIYIEMNGEIGDITADFEGNYSVISAEAQTTATFADNTNSGGGAIFNDNEMGDIVGNFIDNYTVVSAESSGSDFARDYSSGGGAIYNYNGTIGNIEGDFTGNHSDISATATEAATYAQPQQSGGGAIFGHSGEIGDINGDFTRNYTNISAVSSGSDFAKSILSGGGAIYAHQSDIGDIQGDFTENYAIISATSNSDSDADASRAGGGAIFNCMADMSNIDGNFTGNYAIISAAASGSGLVKAYSAGGGAIYNYAGTIGNIEGDFTENYAIISATSDNPANIDDSLSGGGAIYNRAGAEIGYITGDFTGNYATNANGNVYGGAIVNDGTITNGIINSKFIDNHATSQTSAAQGGAIYTTKDLSIIADGSVGDGISTFQGNYTQIGTGDKNYEAIFVDGDTLTLTLEAKDGGTINMYDHIDGGVGYDTKLTGDSDSTINLYSDIIDSDIIVDAPVNVSFSNEVCHDYTLKSLTLDNSDMYIGIDVDLENTNTDRILIPTTSAEQNYLTADGHNIIINAIHILTDGADETTYVTLTNDNRFTDVYKLSDSILSNITTATGVENSYTVSYSNFGKWADGSSSSLAEDKGILVFGVSATDTLATTVVKAGDVKVYILPDGNEEVEQNLGTLVGQSLTITGENKEIHGNDYDGMTLGTGTTTQAVYVNDVAEWSGHSSPAITNGSKGTVNLQNVVFTDNDAADIDNSGALALSGTNSIEKIIDTDGTGTTSVTGGTSTIGSLIQKSVTNSGILNLGDVSTADGITNNTEGGLVLTGGTLDSSISGDGTTVITGDVVLKTKNTFDTSVINQIAQATTVEKNGSLNANVAGIGAAVTVNAEGSDIGKLTLFSQEADGGDLNYAVSGDGTVIFNRNVNVKADVTAKTINVSTFTLGETDYNANVVVADGNSFGKTGGTINVNENNTLTMDNAGDLKAGVVNNGTINLKSGVNSQVISNSAADKGTVNLAGITQNSANITANIIQKTTANEFTNDAGKKLTANSIIVTGTLNSNASDLVLNDTSTQQITNNGTLNLTGGANANKIATEIAASTVNFSDVTANSNDVTAYSVTNTTTGTNVLVNTGAVSATIFENKAGSKWTNSGDGSVTVDGTLTNAGILTTNAEKIAFTSSVAEADKNVNTAGGTLVLTGGETAYTISGANGTTQVDTTADVTFNKAVSTTVFEVVNGSSKLADDSLLSSVTTIKNSSTSDVALSFINDTLTDNINLHDVVLTNNMNIGIDVNLATTPKADNFAADSVTGGKILVNRLNVLADATEVPVYVLVANGDLKDNFGLGSNVTGSSIIDSYLITYTTEKYDGATLVDNSNGYLKFEFSNLQTAILSTATTKVYSLPVNEPALTADPLTLGGESLSVIGNYNKITGGSTVGDAGISLTTGQTLSLSNVTEVSGFKTAITNDGGTVNLTNVAFANNTDADVANGGTLNLYGTDTIKNITGDGVTNIQTDPDGNNAVVNFSAGGTITQSAINIYADNKLGNAATVNSTINNSGILENYGTGSLTQAITNNSGGSIANFGDISGALANAGNVTNSGTIADVTNYGRVDNYSDGKITGNVVNGSADAIITNDGLISGAVSNSGKIENYSNGNISGAITNNEGASLSNIGAITGAIANAGNVVNSGIIYNTVNNYGRVDNYAGGNIQGDITNNEGATLANAGDVTGNIANAGNVSNIGTIYGETNNFGRVDNYDGGNIQGNVTNNENAVFANDGDVTGDIANAGLVQNKGTVYGETNNYGTVENYEDGNIQGNITNNENAVIGNIGAITGAIANAAGATVSNSGTIYGETNNYGTVENYEGGNIQGNITNNEGAVIGNIGAITGAIANAAGATVSNSGTIYGNTNNYGTVENYEGGNIQGDVTNNEGGVLANAGDITGDIANAGLVHNTGTVYGDTNNYGTVENYEGGNIQGDVTNNEGGVLANAGDITGDIANAGLVQNVGTVYGDTNNYGTVENYEGGNIQGDITNNEGGVIGNAGAITGAIANAAGATVSNTGTIYGNTQNDGTLENYASGIITGDITSTSLFVNDGSVINNSVANSGELINNNLIETAIMTNTGAGDVTNNATVSATTLTNSANWDNGANGTISAENLTNEEGGTLITDAGNITMTTGNAITNDGTLKFTAGTNVNNITGKGETVISGTVINDSANISNNLSVTSDGDFTNNNGNVGGTGKNIVNDGVLTNNGNMSGNITNNNTMTNNDYMKGNITNNDTFTNNGTVGNAYYRPYTTVTNSENGQIINNAQIMGIVKNAGNIDNSGNIVGRVNNSGTIDNRNLISGVLNNSGTVNNTGRLTYLINNEGEINNTKNGTLVGSINNKKSGVINTTLKGLVGDDILNKGNIHYTTSGSTFVNIRGNGTVHLDGDGTTTLNNNLYGNTLSLNNGNLIFGKNKDISEGGFIANGGNIVNVVNGKLTTYKLGNTLVAKNTGIDGIDFDLSTLSSDKFIGNYTGSAKFMIDRVCVSGNTMEDYIKIHLSDTTKIAKNNLQVKNQDLPEILTPIRWLKGEINDNYLIYEGRGNGYNDFNPAVMAPAVAAQVGGYNAQLEAFQHGFYHMNSYTKYAASQRLSAENYNKVAIEDNNITVVPQPENPLTDKGMWNKPYTSWETVHLGHGPKVNSFAYGNFFGGDTELVNIGHGFKGVLSAFIGYNGNHMSYDGISMDMQGGTLGITGTAYKGNFFTGITASTGGSGVEASTPYGTDHFGMINAGVANKTGYNWEIKGGRLIVQPTLLVGYTFVNTFDYRNSAGAKIESDPYSSIQIMPELKVIGNTKSGWQPYASVGMVYNIGVGNRTITANDVKLPQLSNRAYVQYGVGVQRSWADRFTAFFETLFRGGGRNGVMLFGGFRWTFGGGSDKSANGKQAQKTVIKQIKK